ncbi:hypothetical protein, conserved [Angomonas deanei]|uniref:Uncharacterized protein n=1 Tax=Angomonas deanei TaxID=59799 RepID=A0A7G2CNE3_9TRYP|nr:hypothetical protein, conserved [Angomonas deanei]
MKHTEEVLATNQSAQKALRDRLAYIKSRTRFLEEVLGYADAQPKARPTYHKQTRKRERDESPMAYPLHFELHKDIPHCFADPFQSSSAVTREVMKRKPTTGILPPLSSEISALQSVLRVQKMALCPTSLKTGSDRTTHMRVLELASAFLDLQPPLLEEIVHNHLGSVDTLFDVVNLNFLEYLYENLCPDSLREVCAKDSLKIDWAVLFTGAFSGRVAAAVTACKEECLLTNELILKLKFNENGKDRNPLPVALMKTNTDFLAVLFHAAVSISEASHGV